MSKSRKKKKQGPFSREPWPWKAEDKTGISDAWCFFPSRFYIWSFCSESSDTLVTVQTGNLWRWTSGHPSPGSVLMMTMNPGISQIYRYALSYVKCHNFYVSERFMYCCVPGKYFLIEFGLHLTSFNLLRLVFFLILQLFKKWEDFVFPLVVWTVFWEKWKYMWWSAIIIGGPTGLWTMYRKLKSV